MLSAALAGGHVLLEDFPGLGKTLAARSFAQTLGLEFRRAQFTPDLLPGDLTGSFIYDQRAGDFSFRKGPLFTGLLLADEINRTPPKTQSALLEAMQERQITVEGETFVLARAVRRARDRQPGRVRRHLPACPRLSSTGSSCGSASATRTPRRRTRCCNADWRRHEEQTLNAISDPASVARDAARDRDGHGRPTHHSLLRRPERGHADAAHIMVGASPRGALGLLLAARSLAVIRGRDFVVPEDVKAVAHPVLAHRLTLKPELWMTAVTAHSVVDAVLGTVPAPSARERV